MFIGFCYGVDPSFTKDLRNWDEALVGLYTCLDERIRGRWLKGHDDVLFIRGCICLVAHLDFGRIGPQHVGKTCGASSHACWTLASKPNIQNLHQIHISYFTFEHYRFQPAMYLHLMICTTFLCLSLFHLPSFCRPASPEINLHIKQKKWFHKIKETLVDYCWLENAKYGGWRSCFFFHSVGCGLYGFISPPLKWPTFRLEPLWRVGATCKEGHLVRNLKSQHVSVMW